MRGLCDPDQDPCGRKKREIVVRVERILLQCDEQDPGLPAERLIV